MKKTENCLISFAKNTTDPKLSTIKVDDYFKGIIDGKWQDEVLKCRSFKNKDEQDRFKKGNVHAVMASGLFSSRSDKDLIEHSGLLVIDIDSKDQDRPSNEIREDLKEIPEIFAIHYSLRGEGLAVYFRIRKDKHQEGYEAITKILANDYNVVCDLSCRNIGRLRFVSYDPDCYLNYGATCWNLFEKKENRVNEHTYDHLVFSENDIDYVMKQIKERGINIATDYYSWLRVGFGLASQLGNGGRDYFKLISSFYSGKQKIDPDKQFDRCLKAGKSGITIKSFFYYAKLAGCSLTSKRTETIKTIGKIRRKQEQYGGSGAIKNGRQDAIKYLDEFEGITGADVDKILDQVWQLPASELKEEKNSLLNDIEVYLKSTYKFRLNEITNIVEVDGEPINDYLFNSIYLQTTRILSDKVTKDKVYDLIHSDFTTRYNPLHEWFDKNKDYKSKGNIKKLADCIDSKLKEKDPGFIEYFLEKWLLSIIGSAYGTYSILCLVLTGRDHGIGKTNFFRLLLPDELQWLYGKSKLDMKEADVAQLMSSKLIILDDEFGGKSKQDEKKFKDLISTDKFSVRMPYGRYFRDMSRLAVLCGTSNEEEIINDITGNRRIIPIQVNSVDEKKFNEIDKTSLFIELYWKWRKDQNGWFLNKDDINRLNDVTSESKFRMPEMELPLVYFDITDRFELISKFMSTSEIRSYIEIRSGIRLSQQKLSIALKDIGFVYDQKKIDGINKRGFYVVLKNDYTPQNNNSEDKNHGELPF